MTTLTGSLVLVFAGPLPLPDLPAHTMSTSQATIPCPESEDTSTKIIRTKFTEAESAILNRYVEKFRSLKSEGRAHLLKHEVLKDFHNLHRDMPKEKWSKFKTVSCKS